MLFDLYFNYNTISKDNHDSAITFKFIYSSISINLSLSEDLLLVIPLFLPREQGVLSDVESFRAYILTLFASCVVRTQTLSAHDSLILACNNCSKVPKLCRLVK